MQGASRHIQTWRPSHIGEEAYGWKLLCYRKGVLPDLEPHAVEVSPCRDGVLPEKWSLFVCGILTWVITVRIYSGFLGGPNLGHNWQQTPRIPSSYSESSLLFSAKEVYRIRGF